MTQNYFVTYKFYNRKGQRLSIFATTREGITDTNVTCGLSIYIVTTSKQDQFNKRWVRTAFEAGQAKGSFTDTGINPVIINLPCTLGDSKKVFMQYCNQNFYKIETNQIMGTNVGLQFDALIKRSYNGENPEILILPSTVHQIKAAPFNMVSEFDSNIDELPGFEKMNEAVEDFLKENGLK